MDYSIDVQNKSFCFEKHQSIGASSGIGAATAQIFAKHGARLALHGRNAQRLEGVAKECREIGGLKEDDVCRIET